MQRQDTPGQPIIIMLILAKILGHGIVAVSAGPLQASNAGMTRRLDKVNSTKFSFCRNKRHCISAMDVDGLLDYMRGLRVSVELTTNNIKDEII